MARILKITGSLPWRFSMDDMTGAIKHAIVFGAPLVATWAAGADLSTKSGLAIALASAVLADAVKRWSSDTTGQ